MKRNETNMAEFAVKGALTRLALFFDAAEGTFSGREVATILLQTWQGYENAKLKVQNAKLPESELALSDAIKVLMPGSAEPEANLAGEGRRAEASEKRGRGESPEPLEPCRQLWSDEPMAAGLSSEAEQDGYTFTDGGC